MKISDYFKPKPHRPIDALIQKLLEPSKSKPTLIDGIFQKRKDKKKLPV